MTTMSVGTNHFPRCCRLLKADDYKKVFSKPKKLSTPDFLFLYCKSNQPFSRLGLAIAKKQFPLSVDRNRTKRLIRESFRRHRSVLTSFDIVVMARKSLLDMDNTQILQQLDKLWCILIQKGQSL